MNFVVGSIKGNFNIYQRLLSDLGDADFLYLLGDFIGEGGNQVFLDAYNNKKVKLILGAREMSIIEAYCDIGNKAKQKILNEQKWFQALTSNVSKFEIFIYNLVDVLVQLPVSMCVSGVYLGSYSAIPCKNEIGPSVFECVEGESEYYLSQLKRACYESELLTSNVFRFNETQCIFGGPSVQEITLKKQFGFDKEYVAYLKSMSKYNDEIGDIVSLIDDSTKSVNMGNSMFISSGLYEYQNDKCIRIEIGDSISEQVVCM